MAGHGGKGNRDEGRRRVADFNMDAPASGCASDLSRRSYDPLSTDNAAASYRAIVVGDLPIPPRSALEAIAVAAACSSGETPGLLPPVTSTVITLCVVFSTLVYVAATSSSPSRRDLARRSLRSVSQLRSRIDQRWKLVQIPDAEIYIRGYDTRG